MVRPSHGFEEGKQTAAGPSSRLKGESPSPDLESIDSWANNSRYPACFLNGITYAEMWSKEEKGSSERETPAGSRHN